MDLGSDTFPRDEVTGLAAFEHLDPVSTVSTLNMMPDLQPQVPRVLTPPPPPPAMSRASMVPMRPRTGATLPPPPPAAARTFSRPPQSMPAVRTSVPAAAPIPAEAVRADATENVELDPPGWDDPEEAATRVQAGSPAAELHMDWDDDEPPTQMRGEVGVGPVQDTARGVALDWDDENIDTRLREAETDVASTSAYQPAGDTGRPSPFPMRPSAAPGHAAYASPAAAAAQLEPTIDAPSPFGVDTAWGQDLRGSDRRTQLWVAAGALAIVVLAFGLRAMFAKEPAGLITLATVPSDARVLVDGKPVSGTSSPFSATDLKPEIEHQLTVDRAGYVTHAATFKLEAGEAKTLPTVALVASSQASGFAIDSVPGGAQIKVDGELVGLSTPARVTQVSTGLHKVELLREGFAPYQVQVFVPDGQVLELPPATLAASTLGTAAAAVSGNDDPSQVAVAGDSEPAKVKRASSAKERRKARRAARRAQRASGAAVASRAAKRVAPTPVRAVAAAAPVGGKAVLRVNSRPWAQVFVDGRMVGNTPQMGIQLAAGKHTIKLVNPEMGLKKSFTFTARAGETETKVLNLIE
jgi:eukaryotic-like serine/threonine-protein kinase